MEYSKSNDIAKEELSIKVGQWVLLRNATGILEGLRVHSIGSAALTLSRNHYSLPVASMTVFRVSTSSMSCVRVNFILSFPVLIHVSVHR